MFPQLDPQPFPDESPVPANLTCVSIEDVSDSTIVGTEQT